MENTDLSGFSVWLYKPCLPWENGTGSASEHGVVSANSPPVPEPTMAPLKGYRRLLLVSAGLLFALLGFGFRMWLETGCLETSCRAPGHRAWPAAAGYISPLDCDARSIFSFSVL